MPVYSRNKPTTPVIRSNNIKEIKTPRCVQYIYVGGDALELQEERTEDGTSMQTLQTSAIAIGKLVSGYYRFKIQFQMYAVCYCRIAPHAKDVVAYILPLTEEE